MKLIESLMCVLYRIILLWGKRQVLCVYLATPHPLSKHSIVVHMLVCDCI